MLCLRSCFLCVSVFCSVIVFVTARADGVDKRFTSYNLMSLTKPVLWVGVLILGKEYNKEDKRVIPVSLIADKTGIADARSMATLNKYDWTKMRNSTRVMFLSRNEVAWYAKVISFTYHEDFIENTLSTLALLSLEYESYKFEGSFPGLPVVNNSTSHMEEQLLTIGYTDRNGVIEQFIYRMAPVHLGECQAFYIVEDLDSKWLQPKHYHCYNVHYSKESCVFDPGMPLVYFSGGKFTLLAVSVWGPGCSLPARYLDIEPFLPWIMTKMPSRRLLSPVLSNYGGPRHKWVVERIHPSKELAVRPLTTLIRQLDKRCISVAFISPSNQNVHLVQGQKIEEIVYGSKFAPRRELIYRDLMTFKTGNGLYNRQQAIAVYALALYDTSFNRTNYTCVVVKAHCSQKSNSILEFTKSIDDTVSPFKSYVKTVPIHTSLYKQLHTIQKTPENYAILGTDVTQLIFRFEFENEAEISVSFYGNRTSIFTTPITTPTTRRRRRPSLYDIRERRPYITSTRMPRQPFYYYEDELKDSDTRLFRLLGQDRLQPLPLLRQQELGEPGVRRIPIGGTGGGHIITSHITEDKMHIFYF